MAANSKIEWCDNTFNPWVGCTKVSPACDNCYAESWAKRSGNPELWTGERRRTSSYNWRLPEKWNVVATATGTRSKVFCASLADVFDNQVPEYWREDLWTVIANTPCLDWLLLTKRPQNIAKMLPPDWGSGWNNVWLGATTENQEEYDRRRRHLLSVPAVVHFFSVEPMLSPVIRDVAAERGNNVWYICGGEDFERPGRVMDLAWARALRDSCKRDGVPFFMKQVSKKKPIPADLMVREFPASGKEG